MDRDLYDLLAEVVRNLDRIANALEAQNNAMIKGVNTPDEHVELYVTTHES